LANDIIDLKYYWKFSEIFLKSLFFPFEDEFAGYITYTRNLKFEEKPDYNWLKA